VLTMLPASRQQMRRGRLDAVEHAAQVEAHDAVPFVDRPLVHLREVARPCVVEHGAEPVELRRRVVDSGTERVVIRDVDRVREPVDLLRDLFGGVAVDVDDRDTGAFVGHAPARRPSDARSASGHDRTTAVEEPHLHLLGEVAS